MFRPHEDRPTCCPSPRAYSAAPTVQAALLDAPLPVCPPWPRIGSAVTHARPHAMTLDDCCSASLQPSARGARGLPGALSARHVGQSTK
eukprot:CAMPEP_0174703424 /NCGR_PEP_ID=MMETSP1094-20130205/7378_1 /TAXON_ID=156173 /ORGANISM="Chrysochromulina brevifilum, Strain UTEX LB 985" /LENGTH=88 /DNA_ID=CAMNT_0015901347 /DNA_START=355 /DNA_END=618 /DNA_ORIENTATION=+